jgi:hypothetical protein
MTDIALPPTPAQERMAAARAARAANLAAVKAESVANLTPELIAQAKAQRAEREAAEVKLAQAQAERTAREEGVRIAPVGPSARAKAAELAAQEELARYDLARARADAVPEEGVKVRILKLGHNKVHKGIHVPEIGDVYYAFKDEPSFPLAIAQRLEDRGLVEILEA